MGRVSSDLQPLEDEWSPVVIGLLNQMGEQIWPPKKRRRSLLAKAETVIPYSIEGPVQHGSMLVWSLFHTNRPSSFDDRGMLQQGERSYWLIKLEAGIFTIQGAETLRGIPAAVDTLTQALNEARQSGARTEVFYGNKGPLSHQVNIGK